jgi:hypothetical protein
MMSGWLRDALAGYLANVSERDLDGLFIAYLQAHGYTDIHQLHGAFEFGKDFIAKRDGEQWVFQTKAGDLNMRAWREVRSQVEEMVWNDIAHPSFDTAMKRRPVLVTTGRLIGGAAADAQQYARTWKERSSAGRPAARRGPSLRRRGRQPEAKTAFEVWDRDDLLAGFEAAPDASLDAWAEVPLHALLGTLADIARREITAQKIERSSRSWPPDDLMRSSLAAGIISQRLAESNRADLACMTAYALARSAAAAAEPGADASLLAMDIARALFDAHSARLLDAASPHLGSPESLYASSHELLASGPIRFGARRSSRRAPCVASSIASDVNSSMPRASPPFSAGS